MQEHYQRYRDMREFLSAYMDGTREPQTFGEYIAVALLTGCRRFIPPEYSGMSNYDLSEYLSAAELTAIDNFGE